MPRPKLNRILLILACIGILLYAVVTVLYGLQPEEAPAAENPSITKQQAAKYASTFVNERYSVKGTETFVAYQSKKERSGYLQKEHLSPKYDETYGKRYPLDYYQVNVTDPKKDRQFEVEINYTDGTVVGWRETYSGNGEHALISKQKADIMAKQEMRARGLDPDDMKAIDKEETGQQASGLVLYYEKQSQPMGEAKLQVRTQFDDQSLVGYSVLFSVPASHLAWLDAQDRSASVMTWISMGSTLIMTLAAIVFAIMYRKQMRFSNGLLLTAIFLAIYITNNFNMYPSFRSISGGGSNAEFATWATIVFMNVLALALGISVYLSLVAGNGLWKAIGQPKWPAWKEHKFGAEVFYGMGRGYLLALFILGIQQVLFYTGDVQFDVWAVNDPSDSMLNMVEPRFFPLMAWVAAISEEATYRLLGIMLFKKLFRNNFIAIVIPSVIWAASHTQYPIYPVYTRLVEVTIIGIILGYVFLKYGFITAVFAHACMDSILMGMSLFSLGHAGDVLTGLFYLVLPALVGCFLAWLHGKRRSPLIPGEPPPRLGAL
ncbi:CPBP family intramembrane glutamic endopeptidase [Paenibacillus planticolens]|uniref:CPBP family intramembrane metalloprotease n=1 Tax=Paenibacillus planticolens TaxID=2654976 RepID=A0ABX1ZJX7_9BACL|nr:type II CAAX endopeptidase family protein [Paenibacillus planticolens]NOU99767.1 CPBP family intramembrane metalloprotease [Paenibacillus planticolens]